MSDAVSSVRSPGKPLLLTLHDRFSLRDAEQEMWTEDDS